MSNSVFVLELIEDADEEPVSLADLKAQIRAFQGTTEDSYISGLGKAAREWVETYTGRAILTQRWRLSISNSRGFIAPVGWTYGMFGPMYGIFSFTQLGELRLRRYPVVSVDSFVSVDEGTGDETAIPSDQFELRDKDSKYPRLAPLSGANWSFGTFRVEFTAGLDDSALVPQRFKQAIFLHAEAHYDRDPVAMQKYIEAAEGLVEKDCSDWALA